MSQLERCSNTVIVNGYEYTFDSEEQAIQFEMCIGNGETIDACLDQLPQHAWTRKKKSRLDLG